MDPHSCTIDMSVIKRANPTRQRKALNHYSHRQYKWEIVPFEDGCSKRNGREANLRMDCHIGLKHHLIGLAIL
jgi:hypothetical protein